MSKLFHTRSLVKNRPAHFQVPINCHQAFLKAYNIDTTNKKVSHAAANKTERFRAKAMAYAAFSKLLLPLANTTAGTMTESDTVNFPLSNDRINGSISVKPTIMARRFKALVTIVTGDIVGNKGKEHEQ